LNNKGFTLIEILITLVIFTLGALALANMQITSTKGSSFGKEAVLATTLAQKKMEELKTMSFNTIAADGVGVTEQNMNVTWTVSENGTAPNRYKNVGVTVSWAGKSIVLHTIVSET
jgi:type IV pilus assembly protein PilV